MKAELLDVCAADVERLDGKLLDGSGNLVLHDADFYKAIPRDLLRAWCSVRGRYLLPTTELVDFLKTLTAGMTDYGKVIEIGAGMGDLGRLMGVPRTDSFVQTHPALRALYTALGQAPTDPPGDVQRLEAMAAVEKYRPHTVIGAYITQRWKPGDIHGFEHGVDAEALLARVTRYILIGNTTVHGSMRILARPHETIKADWIVTRARAPEENRIWIFEGGNEWHA